MALGTFGSTLSDELNRLANGGTYRDMNQMVDEALAAKQWANRENITPYSTDTVGVLNEIAGLGTNRQNWLDFNGVCNYIAGTSGLPAAAALRQIYPTTDLLTGVASYYVDAATPRYNYPGFIRLNGVDGNYISTPDATALDITGDIDLRIKVALDDWTPSASQTLLSKLNTNQYSYQIILNTNGTISFRWSANGTTLLTSTSSVAPTVADGAVLWVRATMDVDNGASGNTVTFFTSNNGSSWTQLGTTIVTAGVTSIFSGTANVEIGSHFAGSNVLTGNVYQAQIFASLNGTDKRLDVDLTTNVTSATYNQFTATTGQLVTINGQDVLTNGGTAGSLLPTTVGSSLAADSNDAKFLDFTGTNYVYLPGVNTSFMSVPDSSALDITDNIDLRAYIAMDDWTPAVNSPVITKWLSAGDQRGIIFEVTTTGGLNLQLSANGLAQSAANSTATMGIPDGTTKWIRATYRRSDQRVQFFTSDNGTTWTQLGADVTSAQNGIFANTADVGIGTFSSGATAQVFAGKIFRAQIFSDITGTTKVLDVDTSVITAGSATSFTAVTGQTVTINRSTSGRKTVAVTQPTWLFGTDDYMEVNNRYMAHSTAAENYVYLSGASGNYMSVADAPLLDVTGDIDIRVNVALDDWTPATNNMLLSKYNSGSAGARSYQLMVSPSGFLTLQWSTNGSTLTNNISSTVVNTITDGTARWVRATLDIDNGSGGNDVRFFTSTDGTTWTQLGTTVTTAGTTSLWSGTAQVELGTRNVGTADFARGKFYRAQILNGIDGTIVLDADASVITLPSQTTFVDRSSNAYTVTINKSGVGTFVSTGNYLYLPGINGNYASIPNSAAINITGDIDLRCKVALDDWTPSTATDLIGKRTSGNSSFRLHITTGGLLAFYWSTDGTNQFISFSSAAVSVADGGIKWVRATMDVDNGASGNTTTFFTSDDGITWTQLGTTVVNAGVTSIFAGTATVEIGSILAGTAGIARGKFFRAQVLNGIGGTVAFDANFENSITSLLQTTFTESSTNGATVTIARTGSTFRSAGVIDAGYLYPGATNTFAASATSWLDFGATDSFTILAVARQWATPNSFGVFFEKTQLPPFNGYSFTQSGTAFRPEITIRDGVNSSTNSSGTPTSSSGTTTAYSMILNRSNQTLYFNINGTSSATVGTSSVGNITSYFPLAIGRRTYTPGLYNDMEFIAGAIFRTVLTTAQIRQVVNYFANREVYL